MNELWNSIAPWISLAILLIQAVILYLSYSKAYRHRIIYGIKRRTLKMMPIEMSNSPSSLEDDIETINKDLVTGRYSILQIVNRSEYDLDVYLGQIKPGELEAAKMPEQPSRTSLLTPGAIILGQLLLIPVLLGLAFYVVAGYASNTFRSFDLALVVGVIGGFSLSSAFSAACPDAFRYRFRVMGALYLTRPSRNQTGTESSPWWVVVR